MAVDYTQFGPNGPPQKSLPNGVARQWWKLSGQDACDSISSVLRFLQEHQSQRLTQYQISARLYGNMPMISLNGMTSAQLPSQPAMRDRITYNVVQSVIDTVGAKIAKSKPKPLFLTSGGDYRMQRRAKKLNQFVDGIFYENRAYELGAEVFRDACVFGNGIVHVFDHCGRVAFERVMPSEIYVDEIEAFYGQPRQLHRVKAVDRAELADAFPSARKLIEEVNEAQNPVKEKSNISDMVTVRQSWHLPSGEDATDGKWVISLDSGIVAEGEWTRAGFPFTVLPWSDRLFGFWGQGLAEQVQNIQLEINKLLYVIQRSMQLAGSFKVLVENNSKIVKEHLNNDIGAIINYTGTAPTYITPPVMQAEVYAHLQTLKNAAYEQAGVSQLSANAQKPSGLDSGKALREYNDIESDRFSRAGQAYEQMFLDLAALSIETVKDITDGRRSYKVITPSRKFIDTIDWKDVNLKEDEYVMQCYPVSSLPNDPAGRLETIQEYMQAGLLSPRQGKRLLDFPDLDQVEGLQNAAEDYLTMILEKIVDDGEYTAPDPFDDLQLGRELALEFYARGKTQDLEPERLEMLQRFIAQIQVLEQSAMQPPPGAMPVGEPQAQPDQAPTSDLLANAPGIQ